MYMSYIGSTKMEILSTVLQCICETNDRDLGTVNIVI